MGAEGPSRANEQTATTSQQDMVEEDDWIIGCRGHFGVDDSYSWQPHSRDTNEAPATKVKMVSRSVLGRPHLGVEPLCGRLREVAGDRPQEC